MGFEIKSDNLFGNVEHGFIIHGCNGQGVMGSGVAAVSYTHLTLPTILLV